VSGCDEKNLRHTVFLLFESSVHFSKADCKAKTSVLKINFSLPHMFKLKFVPEIKNVFPSIQSSLLYKTAVPEYEENNNDENYCI
jgi:hypothetical protein